MSIRDILAGESFALPQNAECGSPGRGSLSRIKAPIIRASKMWEKIWNVRNYAQCTPPIDGDMSKK